MLIKTNLQDEESSMMPTQLDFPFLNNYLDVMDKGKHSNIGDTMRDSEIERWLREYLPTNNLYNAKNTMHEILAVLRDSNESKQIRHYIVELCSSARDESSVTFCKALLANYFVFSVLTMIENRFEPTLDKQAHKFSKKLSSWSRHLEKRIE